MSKQEIFDEAGYLARRARNEARLTDAGVYGPQMEHDACGVGFVAARDGKPTRAVVDAARNSIARLGVGAVDLYALHAPLPYLGGRTALYEGLADAYQLGLCRGVGVCNFNAGQLREAHAALLAVGLRRVPADHRGRREHVARRRRAAVGNVADGGVDQARRVEHVRRVIGRVDALVVERIPLEALDRLEVSRPLDALVVNVEDRQ